MTSSPTFTVNQLMLWLNRTLGLDLPVLPLTGWPPPLVRLWSYPVAWSPSALLDRIRGRSIRSRMFPGRGTQLAQGSPDIPSAVGVEGTLTVEVDGSEITLRDIQINIDLSP